MFNLEDLKILITIAIAVFGWIVAHRLNSIRDRSLKRRELITNHLITAYKILTIDITQREPSLERDLKLESVIAELQLFGSDRQIMLTKKLADDINKLAEFSMDELINDLRNALRVELGLSMIKDNVRWIRFDKNKTGKHKQS
ncbi:MAG: hypothetical protein JWR02_2777 [Mucilaginibacter sp.]|nr:hypothetical protein [Mucilaginibacter sp.]